MLHSEIEFRSISEVHRGFADGTVTVKTLVERYLKTIETLDPKLNAITALNEHAVADAEKLDVRPSSTPSPRTSRDILSIRPRTPKE